MYLDVAARLPRDATTVGIVRAVVTQTLRLYGVDDDCVEDIRLAISEACTNVIEHAVGDDDYEVQVRFDEDRCTISVRDAGGGFDAATLEGTMPSPYSARGRGVAIMRAVMDSVDLDPVPQRGSVLTLVRALTFRGDSPLAHLRRRQ